MSLAVRVPLGCPLRQRLQADPLQFLGDRVVDLAGWARLGRGDLLHDFSGANRPAEWSATGQQLVEDDAQAEDVGSPIDPVPFAPCLLGTHVGGVPAIPPPLPKSSSLSASPKSATNAFPEASIRMLAGLMSRWTKPRVWA